MHDKRATGGLAMTEPLTTPWMSVADLPAAGVTPRSLKAVRFRRCCFSAAFRNATWGTPPDRQCPTTAAPTMECCRHKAGKDPRSAHLEKAMVAVSGRLQLRLAPPGSGQPFGLHRQHSTAFQAARHGLCVGQFNLVGRQLPRAAPPGNAAGLKHQALAATSGVERNWQPIYPWRAAAVPLSPTTWRPSFRAPSA